MDRPGAAGDPTLRIGLIGAARVAPYAIVAPARAVPRATLAAVAARDPRRAAAFAAEHGIATVHRDYRALLADPGIDLVYVATPPATHAALAHQIAAAGKHALIEKPFALDAAEAEQMLYHARTRGVQLFEAMHAPHHLLFGEIAGIVAGGSLGRIRRASAGFATIIAEDAGEFRWDPALGGGALMDLGVYPMALCRALFGEAFEVDSVDVAPRRGVDARMSAALRFGDIAVTIGCSMVDPFDAWLCIEGDKGRLVVDNPVAPSLGHRIELRADGHTRDGECPGATSWTAQLAAVTATLLDGAPFPRRAQDPAASMRAIDRIRAHRDWQAAFAGRRD